MTAGFQHLPKTIEVQVSTPWKKTEWTCREIPYSSAKAKATLEKLQPEAAMTQEEVAELVREEHEARMSKESPAATQTMSAEQPETFVQTLDTRGVRKVSGSGRFAGQNIN